MSSIVSFKVQQTFYLFCFTQEIAIEIFQSILQCKMILALITTIPQLLKRFKQKLKMSQILWASAIIWLIWQHKPRGRNMLDLRNWYIWYYVQRAAAYIWSYSATCYIIIWFYTRSGIISPKPTLAFDPSLFGNKFLLYSEFGLYQAWSA